MMICRRRALALLGHTLLTGRVAAAEPEPDVHPVTVAAGLRHPWSLAFLPDRDWLVTEKDGTVVRVRADGSRVPLRGVPDDAETVRQDPRDNCGWFDVALHPQHARNGRLFLTYAARGIGGTTTRLIAARLDGDRLRDVEPLFDALPFTADRFHYGGGLLVADGHLFLSVGERHFNERDNPPLPVAQDPADRRGKIFRFTLDGALAPPPESWPNAWYACGIRATQGLALRPGSGQIWFSEHGSVGGDEINLLRPGANYGWPVRTDGRYRNTDYRPARTLADVEYSEPVHRWRDRTVAPAGLSFYTGHGFPEWQGQLLVAGLSRGSLTRLVLDGDRVVAEHRLMRQQPVRLRNVRVSTAGDLFAVTDEANGRILRLDRPRH